MLMLIVTSIALNNSCTFTPDPDPDIAFPINTGSLSSTYDASIRIRDAELIEIRIQNPKIRIRS